MKSSRCQQPHAARLLRSVAEKLHPKRFQKCPAGWLRSLLFLIDAQVTSTIVEIVVSSDGFVLAGVDGDVGTNHFIGTYSDLLRKLARVDRNCRTDQTRTHCRRDSLRQQDRPFRSCGRNSAGPVSAFSRTLHKSLDRLTREGTFATLQYLRRLSDLGTKFKSYTEQYIDSLGVFGEAIIAVLAAVAQQERIKMSERTKAGLARVRSHGKKLGRPRLKDLSNASRATIWRHKKATAAS